LPRLTLEKIADSALLAQEPASNTGLVPERVEVLAATAALESLTLPLDMPLSISRLHKCAFPVVRAAGVPDCGRPFVARRFAAKQESERSDSSPRVGSARSVASDWAMAVYAAMAGDRIGTTRGGCEGYERRELSRRAKPAAAGRHARGANRRSRSGWSRTLRTEPRTKNQEPL